MKKDEVDIVSLPTEISVVFLFDDKAGCDEAVKALKERKPTESFLFVTGIKILYRKNEWELL